MATKNPTLRIELLNGSFGGFWQTICTTDFYETEEAAVSRLCDSMGIDASRVRAITVEG
jgi:hypothetical protein